MTAVAIGVPHLLFERSSGNLVAEFERRTLAFLEGTHWQGIAQLLRHTLQQLLDFGLGELVAIRHHRAGSFCVASSWSNSSTQKRPTKFLLRAIIRLNVGHWPAQPEPGRLESNECLDANRFASRHHSRIRAIQVSAGPATAPRRRERSGPEATQQTQTDFSSVEDPDPCRNVSFRV